MRQKSKIAGLYLFGFMKTWAIYKRCQLTSTFSIVAFDPSTKDLGVAVQSRYFSVGSVVPWAEADVGAVAELGIS